jgi:hypothetical protein
MRDQASVDIESLAAIKKKAAALEAQLNKAGIAPEAQVKDLCPKK